MSEAFKARKILSAEYKTKHKKGHYIPVSARGGVYEDQGIIKFIGIIRNISEQHYLKEKLIEFKKKYENLRNTKKKSISTEKHRKNTLVLRDLAIIFIISIFSIRRWRELLHEITIRKRIEEKLKESEEKYRKAYKIANFYKDVLAHDINNILNNILMSSKLSTMTLNKPSNQNKIEEYLNIINDKANKGADLISNVRKFFEIDELKILIQLTDL